MSLKLIENFLLFYYFVKLQRPVQFQQDVQKSMIVKIITMFRKTQQLKIQKALLYLLSNTFVLFFKFSIAFCRSFFKFFFSITVFLKEFALIKMFMSRFCSASKQYRTVSLSRVSMHSAVQSLFFNFYKFIHFQFLFFVFLTCFCVVLLLLKSNFIF